METNLILTATGRPDFQAMEHPQTPEQKERVRNLKEIYKLDPVIMKEVDDQYGPFDWRLPDAHAAYWAVVYRQHAKPNAADMDTLRRSIFQSMRMACFRGGALSPSVTNITQRTFMLWPNLDLVPKINAAYTNMIAEQPDLNFQNAHRNFLKEAIPLLYENGRIQQAAYWFDYLNKTYTNAFVGRQAGISLYHYVVATETENMNETDRNLVNAGLRGLFTEECELLLRDQDDEALNCELYAQRVYEHYLKKIGSSNDPRLTLPSLKEIKQRTVDELLSPKNAVLSPYNQAYLRTKLKLPASAKPASATPPAAAEQAAGPQ